MTIELLLVGSLWVLAIPLGVFIWHGWSRLLSAISDASYEIAYRLPRGEPSYEIIKASDSLITELRGLRAEVGGVRVKLEAIASEMRR